jgi:hypothetical protein
MAEGTWFYVRNGQQQGPVSVAQLRQYAAPTDLVWQNGMTDWVPAHSVPGLLPPAAPRPPMAPPGMPGQPVGYYAPQPGQPANPNDIGQNAGMRMLLPVGRSGWAIAAGYLGLFSVLVCPAPIAVVISIIAIMDIKKHPERHGMGRAIFGLVMGGLFSIGLMIGVVVNLMHLH